MKVLVIGFDGATWDLIKPWVDEGKLPTFKKLMDNGVWGPLESTIPPITIPAWISMFSGKTPEKLGIFDFKFISIEGGHIKTKLVNSGDIRGNLVWDFLSRKGIVSLVLSIPGTYPPYRIKGHIVGFDFTPLENHTYPKDLEELLVRDLGLDQIKKLQKKFHRGKNFALKIIYEEEKKILNILAYLVEKFDYDVIFVRFGVPDHVSHHSVDEEEMTKCHIFMDNILKTILEIVSFDCLILVSDHGIKKEEEIWYINKSFEQVELLKMKKKAKILNFIRVLLRTVIGEEKLKKLYRVLTGQTKKRKTVGESEALVFGVLDTENTKAFGYVSVLTNFCPVYILYNKQEKLIIKKINRLPNIKNIYINKTAQPRIIIESNKIISPTLLSDSIEGKKLQWIHSLHGIFLAYGKGIKKGCKIDGAKIYDVAPTILHIIGLPIPNDMDGRVLMEIFEQDSEFVKRKPVYVDPNYYYEAEDEIEKIRDKIRELKLRKRI